MINPQEIQARSLPLIAYSDKIYPVIHQEIKGQRRSRRIMRLGIQALAQVAEQSSEKEAGEAYISILHANLQAGGITREDTAAWPAYNTYVDRLPSFSPDSLERNPLLDILARNYADVARRTIGIDGDYETDGNHVVHLGALAVPYALEYYAADLDPAKVAALTYFHDFGEPFVGDTTTLGATKEDLRAKDEREAKVIEIINRIYSKTFPRFVAGINEYFALDSDESRFVKLFDKLEPKFPYSHSKGNNLARDYQITPDRYIEMGFDHREKMHTYGHGFEDIIAMHEFMNNHFIGIPNQVPISLEYAQRNMSEQIIIPNGTSSYQQQTQSQTTPQ